MTHSPFPLQLLGHTPDYDEDCSDNDIIRDGNCKRLEKIIKHGPIEGMAISCVRVCESIRGYTYESRKLLHPMKIRTHKYRPLDIYRVLTNVDESTNIKHVR